MRDRIVIANWKMNGSREANRLWAEAFLALPAPACRTAVCAPFIYLPGLITSFEGSPLLVGAEDVNEFASGAYTGETSAGMLADFGIRLAIIGHSERRRLFGDTDERVAAKAVALQQAGIHAVLCVGETLEEREADQTEAVILKQLNAVLEAIPVSALGAVAYEPVWAIGTGRSADPETAQRVHAAIRARLVMVDPVAGNRLPILYGGSVSPKNAADLFAQPDIDGALVGGASLKADSFHQICEALDAKHS